MKYIDVAIRKNVAVVKLSRDVTNAIDLHLIREISDCLAAKRGDESISGCVLTSANEKFFSIGFDIPALIPLRKKDFGEFYRAFNRLCVELYSFPKPVVAAITGHAVAGGCILTLCCDYRFISDGKKLMGLNEIKLGVPLPYPADCILRQIVDDRSVRKVLDTGDFFLPEETLSMGLVDGVMPLDKVLPASIDKVKSIASLSLAAFCAIKHNRTEMVLTQIRSSLAEKERIFIEMWDSPATREKLKAALEKF